MKQCEITSDRWYLSENGRMIHISGGSPIATALKYDPEVKFNAMTSVDISNGGDSALAPRLVKTLPSIGDIVAVSRDGDDTESLAEAIVVSNPRFDEFGNILTTVYAELFDGMWLTYSNIDIHRVTITTHRAVSLEDVIKKGLGL